jgi:hypothetical protein
MVYNTAGLTSTSQQVTGLLPNSLYYWRVRSADATQQGFYSVKYTFTTGTSTGLSEAFSDFKLMQLKPNPANDVVQLELNTLASVNLDVELSDITGKVVFSEVMGVTPGLSEHTLDISLLEKGMYFLTIQSEKGKVVRRFLKV